MRKILIMFFIFIFSLCIAELFFVSSSFASTLSLSPAASNIPQENTVSVQVKLNTDGESVNAVSAYLSYSSDKLSVSYISYGLSAFPIQVESVYGAGSINISLGSISGIVGNVNVATIGFVGKSQGAATASFVGGSAVPRTSDSSDSLNLGGSTGGVFTVTPPKPEAQKDTDKPVISNINVSSISTNSATITWKTSEKADSTLEYGEYGLDYNKYFLRAYDENLVTEHTIILQGQALMPGGIFHFRVKSRDESLNEGVSNDFTFQLEGHLVKVKVVDKKSNPIKNTEVLLYNSSPLKSKTDSSGTVFFANVTEGRHLVAVRLKENLDKTGEIVVTDSFALQSFVLTVDSIPSKIPASIFYILAIALFIIGIIRLYIFIKRRKKAADIVSSQGQENVP